MDQDLITDITLDHLPDLSDASISFQIPSNNASADLLLVDNTNGFEVLCNAVDDDASFAQIPLRQPRGPPLTLGELTPMAQVAPPSPRRPRSPTRTHVPSSSAKPSVIQRPLTLGHRSPEKPRMTPSRIKAIKSIHRHRENPLVSEERFQQLREEVGTLGHEENESPAHVQIHVMDSANPDSLEWRSLPHVDSKVTINARDIPPQSEDLLDHLPEKKDVRLVVVEGVVMATGDSCHADTADVAVRAPMPKSRRIPRTSKPTVAAGGISKRTALPPAHVSKKMKGKPPRVQEAHPVHPSAACQPTPPQSIAAEEELAPPAWKPGDLDLKPEKTRIAHTGTGGLAERLVSYSQKLISSIGLYKPSPENSSLEAPEDAVRVANVRIETQPTAARPPSLSPQCIIDIPTAHSEPLRLSEISPHKLPPEALRSSSPANTGILQDGRRHAMSPMRPAKKRVSMDVDRPPEYLRRKRGKTMTADAGPKCGSSNEVVSQGQPPAKKAAHVHKDHVTHPETCDSMQHAESSKSTLPSPRTKYRPKLTSSSCKGPTLDAFPYLSGSRQVHERIKRAKGKRDGGQSNAAGNRSVSSLSRTSGSSHSRLGRRVRQENATESSHTRQRSGPTSTVDLPLIETKQNAATFVAELTKPVGFTFRVDARLEARKSEERLAASEPGKMQPLLPVPDVKAHRASHQAAFIIHKREGFVPGVPVVPFFFCTERRAKEREKFDEMVKHKEEETQRLKEEQRRRDAEEEEMAIKELRRKAIPKANEVPEWYADMPKRKGTAV